MAYLFVSLDCINETHDCSGQENTPEQVDGEFICGGGICICHCHSEGRPFSQALFEEVREYSKKRYENQI